MDRIEEIINEYENRKNEAQALASQVVSIFQNDSTLYPKEELPIVHSIKWRIKSPDHLRDKLVRKKNKADPIIKDNFLERITDLAGVRILHLYNAQFPLIDNVIKKQIQRGNWVLKEDPVANTWDPEMKDYYEKLGFKTELRDTLYTSIHYVIRLNNNYNTFCCEIQVRTLFEEIWGEIDHAINYPYNTESIACREQLKVLSKLTNTGTRLADSIFKSFGEYETLKKK